MPRKSLSKAVDVLGELDIQPAKDVQEYLTSKATEKVFMKPPNFDSAGDELDILYISERLEHDRNVKILKDLQEHKKLQTLVSLQRTRKISKDQAELHNRFVSVNAFIRDFSEKKRRAQRKIHKEIKEQTKITNEINLKVEKFDDMKLFRKKLLATANDYKIYENVIRDAAEKTKTDVNALINRCDAIMVAQDHINQSYKEKMKSIEVMHKQIVDITKKTCAIYGALMNEFNQISRFYFKAKQECFRWEQTLLKAQAAIIEQSSQKEFVRDGIEQLYRVLCKRKNVTPSLVRNQMVQQLDFIKDEVEILQEIVNKYNNPT